MIELLKIIYVISIIIIVIIVLLILIQKSRHVRLVESEPKVRSYVFNVIEDYQTQPMNFSQKRLFKSFKEIEQQLVLSEESKKLLIQNLFTPKYMNALRKRTRSKFKLKRLFAAHQLSRILNDCDFLTSMIEKEKNHPILFYLFYFSIEHMNQRIYDCVMTKVKGMNSILLDRFSVLIANHYDVLKPYIIQYSASTVYEHLFIQVMVARKQLSYNLPESIFKDIMLLFKKDSYTGKELKLMIIFLDYLKLINHHFLFDDAVLFHPSIDIKKYAYIAYANTKQWTYVEKLFSLLSDSQIENQLIIEALSNISSDIQILNKLFYYSDKLERSVERKALAKIISEKIDYILLKLKTSEEDRVMKNFDLILEFNYLSGLIAFINQNNDIQIETIIFDKLSKSFKDYPQNKNEILIYVKADILSKYGYESLSPTREKKETQPPELSKIIWMFIMFFVAISFYPLLSLVIQINDITNISFSAFLKNFVLDTNRNLIYYFVMANIIYFVLLVVSLRGSYKQNELWFMKSLPLLYEDELLPAISIIAPAYNEEVNIITSIRSLLNLKYPKYEVIVVNDGSKDATLDVLIKHFKLKRYHPFFLTALKTKTVQGIYKNSDYPNLIVVNKANGGKADALNVGINVANYPYICGIDADSVLEQDALLRLMSSSLDYKDRPVALGGNIVPANGCKIDHGYIEEKHLPKEPLTRFQAIEYVRAFTTGRIGWSEAKSLLIISGAFGLFYKKDIIKIGGYITSSGDLKKDSVGEDMELVVRLTYQRMKEKKKQYIGYVYHANCYTELPSDMHTLLKQRNRWHRGLLDILSYHRQLFLNPRYKQIGLLATPYFYIFEVLGPFFEWIGYLMLVLSFIFGYLSSTIVLAIFGVSIILGMIISLFSVLIQESQSEYMSKKDLVSLMLFAVLENFGYRQILSLHRVYSFFTAMFEKGHWGEQKRKGI